VISTSGTQRRPPVLAPLGLAVLLAAGLFLVGSVQRAGASTISPTSTTSTTLPAPTSLTVSLPQKFSGCDPVGGQVSASTAQVLSLILPYAYVSNDKGVTIQATSFLQQAEVQSLTPLQVLYTIDPNAHWIDGHAIGLADFLATWKWGASSTGTAMSVYRDVASIAKTKSPNQVLVTFKRPNNDWRALFSPLLPATTNLSQLSSCSVPTAAFDLSAGPYVLASSSPTSLVLICNPLWWGPRAPFDTVTITGGIDPQLTTYTPSTPGLAQANWLPGADLAGITSSPGLSSKTSLSNLLVSLDFNTTTTGNVPPPIRQAIAHYLNRTSLIAQSVGSINPGIAPAGSHLYSQGQPGYVGPPAAPLSATTTTTTPSSSSIQLGDQAMRRGRFHLQGGRWVGGQGRPVVLSTAVPIDDHWAFVASLSIKSQLAAHGITLRLEPTADSAEVASLLRQNKVNAGLMVRPTSPFTSESAQWFTTTKGQLPGILWAGFTNAQLNKLALQARQNLNPVDSLPLYAQIDKQLWTQLPSLPLFTEPFLNAWSSAIAGVTANPYPPGELAALLNWKAGP